MPTFVIECWNSILKQNKKAKKLEIRNIDSIPIVGNYKLNDETIATVKYHSLL